MAAGRAVNTESWGSRRRASSSPTAASCKVNLATLETTAPGVYCIGDVAGPADAGAQGEPRGRRTWRS